MARLLADWLSAYLKYTEDTEPPLAYHTWVGISAVAAALQRKVNLPWGHSKIYPNLYIVLIGPSGRCRKGTAMDIGRDIIRKVGIPTTSESITREALIRRMQEATQSYNDPTTRNTVFHCSYTAISEELSVFLGQGNIKFLADLTDWYDSRDHWTYDTKGQGTDKLVNLCFNLLGATAPDWLRSILPEEAIGGGFTSRIIFIVESEKRKTCPRPIFTKELSELRIKLIKDLETIHTLVGEMVYTEEADIAYTDWYIREEEKISRGNPAIDDPRFAGYVDRRATHLRKLCMIFSASRSTTLSMTIQDFENARKLLEAAEGSMAKTFSGMGQARYSEITEKVISFIIKNKRVKRSDLMRLFYRDVDGYTLAIIEDVMKQMKIVRLELFPQRNEIVYHYIGEE